MEYLMVSNIVHKYIKSTQQSPFFISDWDSNDDSIIRPESILKESLIKSLQSMDSYFFIEDDFGKENIISFFGQNNFTLDKDAFIIGPNSSLMLTTAFIALKEYSIDKILIILPVYFSIPQILRVLNLKYYTFSTKFPNYELDFSEIKREIQNYGIKAIFITDPFYGAGINVPLSFYKQLINYANEKDIFIIVDYARGAMKWNSKSMLMFDFQLYACLIKANKYIFIDSISKRIFVNGCKSSLLFSNNSIINKIRKLGDCFIGSMSAAQMEFVKHLYCASNIKKVNDLIYKNVCLAQSHYELIQTFLCDKNVIYTTPTDGNYMLIGIPKSVYNYSDDLIIFEKILYKYNIYTLPQSLYTNIDANYYIFRVNLLLDIKDLLSALSKLLAN